MFTLIQVTKTKQNTYARCLNLEGMGRLKRWWQQRYVRGLSEMVKVLGTTALHTNHSRQ